MKPPIEIVRQPGEILNSKSPQLIIIIGIILLVYYPILKYSCNIPHAEYGKIYHKTCESYQ